MRKRRTIINFSFSLLLELVTVVYGFVVPRLIIGAFGSNLNGLTNSIASFIGYITLLQSGVGTVAKVALYKPLAKNDSLGLSIAIRTVENFFQKMAVITAIYVVVLSFVYPLLFARSYNFWFVFSLIIIIGISTAAQYFFGITYQMLLEADQSSYVYSFVQIISIIANTLLVVILINKNANIHIIKLASAIVFVIRPFIVNLYAKRKYKITKVSQIDNNLIKQRWDGFFQAIAYFIHSKTDVFVLTVFSSFSNVSVYSVYAMVTTGLTTIIRAADRAVGAAFGNIIACEEKNNLHRVFNAYNTFIHIIATILFSTASVSIYQFIGVYVKNVNDANYIQPIFGSLLIAAEYIYCLRLPYNSIINAAGKFKETKWPALIEALINIIVSVSLVGWLGLLGVAIGTFSAMLYRLIAFMLYLKKEVLQFSAFSQIKRILISIISYITTCYLLIKIQIPTNSYYEWVLYATVIFALSSIITLVFNFAFAGKDVKHVFNVLLHKRKY